jgi:uncharacterized damage-inducible protein DinB
MSFAQFLADYEQGPALLRAAVAGMTAEQVRAKPVPGKMSTLEVVCHIADFEPIYADRMKRVLAEEQPKILSGDPDLFQKRLAYDQRDLAEELDLIEVVRKQMARILRTATPSDAQRTGVHSADGPLSLETLLKRIAGHIPHHVKFIQEKRAALGIG